MNKIIKSNEHEVAVKKSTVGSIRNVTTEATRDSGYDDNSDRLDQQQQQQQQKQHVDKVHSQAKMISKKSKIPVDKSHSKKRFKADNNKNNCDDSSNSRHIQIPSLNKEESVTIRDKIVLDNSIDVDKSKNSKDHLMRLGIKLNRIANSFKDNNRSCTNKVVENVEHQKNTRIRTGSLVPKKYSFCTEEDDQLSSTADENDLDDNIIDVDDELSFTKDDDDDDDDDNNNNNLNQNENLENKIKSGITETSLDSPKTSDTPDTSQSPKPTESSYWTITSLFDLFGTSTNTTKNLEESRTVTATKQSS
ncbi:suppressor of Mek1-like [Aphidius gifuensis]|uniref:suppressor of Mek1-like n=1 Tax=Aphidius gifuensis TaxID=684658 RepID=UPI001CDBBD4C|nr:suppressor of Mek1-like [Aphidius gifuensis]